MMKQARLCLTLWLMLLTVFMPPMAFACASRCAIASQQKISSLNTPQDSHLTMHCHSANRVTLTNHHATPALEKSIFCSATMLCQLTVGMSATPPLSSQILTTHALLVSNTPIFTPQVTLSPPDKPPRFST
jgi:hypothetical protein